MRALTFWIGRTRIGPLGKLRPKPTKPANRRVFAFLGAETLSAERINREIKTDPLGVGYAGMTADQAQASLLTVNRTRNKPLDAIALNAWAAGGGRHAKIRRAAFIDDTLSDEVASVAMSAYRMLERSESHIDVTDAASLAFLDALIAAGVLSAADKTALIDAGTETVSRASEIGCIARQRQPDGSIVDNVRIGWLMRAGLARAN